VSHELDRSAITGEIPPRFVRTHTYTAC